MGRRSARLFKVSSSRFKVFHRFWRNEPIGGVLRVFVVQPRKVPNEPIARHVGSKFQAPRAPRLRVNTKITKRTQRRCAVPSLKFLVQSSWTVDLHLPDFAPLRLCVKSSETVQVTSVATELPNEPIREIRGPKEPKSERNPKSERRVLISTQRAKNYETNPWSHPIHLKSRI
jgi:hypothetical protein